MGLHPLFYIILDLIHKFIMVKYNHIFQILSYSDPSIFNETAFPGDSVFFGYIVLSLPGKWVIVAYREEE